MGRWGHFIWIISLFALFVGCRQGDNQPFFSVDTNTQISRTFGELRGIFSFTENNAGVTTGEISHINEDQSAVVVQCQFDRKIRSISSMTLYLRQNRENRVVDIQPEDLQKIQLNLGVDSSDSMRETRTSETLSDGPGDFSIVQGYRGIFNQLGRPPVAANRGKIESTTPRAALQVGGADTFFLNDGNGHLGVVRYVGTYCYVVQDASSTQPLRTGDFSRMGQEFDRIYPIYLETFGSPPNPGIDGDSRIFIVLTSAMPSGVIGYFNPIDQYFRVAGTVTAKSNMKDLLYISDNYYSLWVPERFQSGLSVIAHEFQHLINYRENALESGLSEEAWVDEGLSTLGEHLSGYGLPGEELIRIDSVQKALAAWDKLFLFTQGATSLKFENYGMSYLFFVYLFEKFGRAAILNSIRSPLNGFAAIEKATGKEFDLLFQHFARVVVMDGWANDPENNFSTLDLHGRYGNIRLIGPKITKKIKSGATSSTTTGSKGATTSDLLLTFTTRSTAPYNIDYFMLENFPKGIRLDNRNDQVGNIHYDVVVNKTGTLTQNP